ncbi:sensor histidine kinase [Rhodococcus sp. IEGM 1318]|uniref:sensor histidine kinase n=1 Tax=Rhodococcus sp. IEGM 1318 TaxID=3082226 RepID=UPI002954AB60|nr:histidine kinase [Rhodococcus sp. IEGM 1318]MDV8009442.1 histidine kinase [Rhodococcus sp. IEGM 1318]
MTGTYRSIKARVGSPLLAAAPVVLAALDVWLTIGEMSGRGTAVSCLGVLALVFRRKYPVAVFLCTLPTLVLGWSFVVPAVSAYAVGRYCMRQLVAATCVGVLAGTLIFGVYPTNWSLDANWFVSNVIFNVMLASAPVLLGRLVAARVVLSARLLEITAAREHEDALLTESALARDRAQLAREMHDVVSHQVGLIAVRAGTLQMTTADPDSREAAATIRQLSVKTLDELRHMVSVLRAAGTGPTELFPQPTIAELTNLVEQSGLDVSLSGELPPQLGAAAQRAIYRTVQEGLTNVRKHAPGARVEVCVSSVGSEVSVVVADTGGARPDVAVALPGSRHGLRGLTERAELLAGTLTVEKQAAGGFRLELRLPRTP